ncbi:MAG TPA: hypothetical protein DCQ26_08060 [Marinilabiliales bacterium]|nr:hypothetical protein [Marinilabiliales bacterium]HBY52157.1 hypothetical protein [Marinilabiliales bacterium]
MPNKITTTVNTTDKVEYLYDATGTKLAKRTSTATNPAVDEYYMGDVVMVRAYPIMVWNIEYLLTPEGRVDFGSGSPVYEYHLKDHLGNTRVAYIAGTSGAADAVQEADYYPFGMKMASALYENSTNKYLYNGKELQDNLLGNINLDWYDYGFRFYDPQIGRWHVIDPMVENNHHDYTPYAYAYNNPILYIDPVGLDTTIYVFDQGERPKDNGTKGETYTAEIYIDIDGEIVGPYSGSSYPNSKSNSNSDNNTSSNTVKDGEHKYNNESGHDKGTKKGLNIDDSNNDSRTASGTNPKGEDVTMTGVNVHEGKSDNGNYNSRGSRGCVTINPKDSEAFFNNFDWSKNSAQTKGNSSGTIVIHRGNTASSMVDKLLINIKKLF